MSNLLKRIEELEAMSQQTPEVQQELGRMKVQGKPQSLSANALSNFAFKPTLNTNVIPSEKRSPVPPFLKWLH